MASDPQSLLPQELVDELGDEVATIIPAGTKFEADAESWMPSTAGGGVIRVTLTYPDGTSAAVAAVVDREQDQWIVLQTIPLEE
jgi:hypothetical protein